MSQWTEHQKQCLKELDVPIWEFRGTVAAPEQQTIESGAVVETTLVNPAAADNVGNNADETSDSEAENTSLHQKPALYRLACWYLQFPEPMPGTGYDWVRDLGKAYNDRATQVSNAPEDAQITDCTDYAASELTPDQKRTLWRRLKEIAVSSNS